jgi:feruloyl esterase
MVSRAQSDPQHDLTLALERWVEQGVAPEMVIATKRQGANSEAPALRARPLCPYPQVARYKGSGGTDDAANFNCVMEQPDQKKKK